MPPRPRPPCAVCHDQPSKYACASCRVDYCSVACYKTHKETCTSSSATASTRGPLCDGTYSSSPTQAPPSPPLHPAPSLRPLTSLKWPYVPDASAYPNPLTRDDPKALQLPHYEAIATSPAVRALLADARLCEVLTEIDGLRGREREEALGRALGVGNRAIEDVAVDEGTHKFRALAEAVEAAVRGDRKDALGLDWD